MKIQYQNIKLSANSRQRIEQANDIIREYDVQGFTLTLRQLYYQFVARGIVPNNDREYKKLGDIVANGRLAGLIDWEAITDRTRFLRSLSHWDSPGQIIKSAARSFRLPKWEKQPNYIEVWIEKDALIGVIEGICQEFDVPYLACRGYASASEIWRAGHNRLRWEIQAGKRCCILYLGDHDPSGLDMTRDIEERLNLFTGHPGEVDVVRLALNPDQIAQYQPPPNPTKITDSRAEAYIRQHGHECWELDALSPTVISGLIRKAIEQRLDQAAWDEVLDQEKADRKHLSLVAEKWDSIVDKL